ncbi:MAG: hypothetical protein LUE27_11155 [Clostridia bacterium]|nr:hypothetical protein [Clostridia bacterium]
MFKSIILSIFIIPTLCCSAVVNLESSDCDDFIGEEQASCINEDLEAKAADLSNVTISQSYTQSYSMDCIDNEYPNGCYVRHSMNSTADSYESYCSEDESWISSGVAKYLEEETDINPMVNPGISLSSVIGDDGRTLIKNPKVFPYICTAYIHTEYNNIFNQSKNI